MRAHSANLPGDEIGGRQNPIKKKLKLSEEAFTVLQ